MMGSRTIREALLRAVGEGKGEERATPPTFGSAVSTGSQRLDDLTGGIRPGDVSAVSGPHGRLVSEFGLHVARHAALVQGIPVGIVSDRNDEETITATLLAAESAVPLSAIFTGNLDRTGMRDLEEASRRFAAATVSVHAETDRRREVLLEGAVAALDTGRALLVVDTALGREDPASKDLWQWTRKRAQENSLATLVTTPGDLPFQEPDVRRDLDANVAIRVDRLESGSRAASAEMVQVAVLYSSRGEPGRIRVQHFPASRRFEF